MNKIEFEFVRTEEFDENLEALKDMFQSIREVIRNPKELVESLCFCGILVVIYFGIILIG